MKESFHYTSDTSWTELHQPTTEELIELMNEYDLPQDLVDELATERSESRVELRKPFIFSVFYFPAFQHTHQKDRTRQEVKFILTPSGVITVHHDTIDALHKFRKMTETKIILGNGKQIEFPYELFFSLMRKLYKSVYHELQFIDDWIDRVEEDVFRDKEREMVTAISQISRRLLDMEKTLHLHDELLFALREAGEQLYDETFSDGIEATLRDYHKLQDNIQVIEALIDELRETNNSLLSTKQNETMNRLTMIAVMALPLTIVASFFGMNTSYMPLIGAAYDFWIIVGVMIALALLTFLGFRMKGWL